MAATKSKTKAKKAKVDAPATATVAGTGNPGTPGKVSLAARRGKKAKPKAAKKKSSMTEVTVDEKLPGHAAAQSALKARKGELTRRIGVYEKLSKNKDKTLADEALRLIEETRDELKKVETDLGKTGLLSDEVLEAIGQRDNASARIGVLFDILDPILEAKRLELSRATGEYISSLRVNGAVTYIGTSRVNGLKTVNEDALRAVFGARYDQYFHTVTQMKLNMEALEADQEFAAKLLDAIIDVCEENGKVPEAFLDEEETLVAKKVNDKYQILRERVMNETVQEVWEQAQDEKLLAPWKATLKK